MDFLKQLRDANIRRLYDFGHDEWAPEIWALATVGEAGEAANAQKKMYRGDGTREQVAREIADMLIYADLWAWSLGLDTEQIIRETFNAKSDQIGSEVRLHG